jgi:plasmid stabilization system protein ParE
MAHRLAWSPEAIEDIEAIASYIERDSLWYARAVVAKIVETAETIPDHPELGRIVPEIDDRSIRERFVYSDPVELDRVNVYEEWESEDTLLRFRGDGPGEDLSSNIVRAKVARHIVASSGPA